jgi:hypothetical protein
VTRQVNRTNITYLIYFNSTETTRIMYGGTVCAGTIGRVPVIGAGASTVCGVASAWAASARLFGACVGMKQINYNGTVNRGIPLPFYHDGSRC